MDNKIIDINEKGRDFIVGDLHGMYNLLSDKLQEIKFDAKVDRLFSVGDLIDRGPDSLKCLNLVTKHWFYPVRGNHEQFLLDNLLDNPPLSDIGSWYFNGGQWIDKVEDKDYLHELAKMVDSEVPLTLTVKTKHGNIGICHAEPPTNDWNDVINLEGTSEDPLNRRTILEQRLMWARILIHDDQYEGTKNIDLTIHGHTLVKEIVKSSNYMFIDTGAFYTEKLTLIRIDDILDKKDENYYGKQSICFK